jgi:chemotaxis protein MotB
LLIEGHTDATPYSDDANYSNWELSADRANSARRLLQQHGVRSDQVTQVRGYADQFLRVKNNPTDPSNRRISILVKNLEGPVPELKGARVVEGPPPIPQGAAPGRPGPTTAQTQISPSAPMDAKKLGAGNSLPSAAIAKPMASKPGLVKALTGMLPGAKK